MYYESCRFWFLISIIVQHWSHCYHITEMYWKGGLKEFCFSTEKWFLNVFYVKVFCCCLSCTSYLIYPTRWWYFLPIYSIIFVYLTAFETYGHIFWFLNIYFLLNSYLFFIHFLPVVYTFWNKFFHPFLTEILFYQNPSHYGVAFSS